MAARRARRAASRLRGWRARRACAVHPRRAPVPPPRRSAPCERVRDGGADPAMANQDHVTGEGRTRHPGRGVRLAPPRRCARHPHGGGDDESVQRDRDERGGDDESLHLARHQAQRHAKCRDDERELPDLAQRRRDDERESRALAQQPHQREREHAFPHHDHGDQREYARGLPDQYRRFEQHADRHEEQDRERILSEDIAAAAITATVPYAVRSAATSSLRRSPGAAIRCGARASRCAPAPPQSVPDARSRG